MNLTSHPAVARLRRQFDEVPWLRWAALLIAVLVGVMLLSALEGFRVQWQDRSIAEESRLRRIKALRGQDVWLSRAEQSAALHASLMAQVQPANTQGAAQASLQAWLQGLANSTSRPDQVRISVEGASPVESIPGVIRLRATLQGAMSPRQALSIARAIEGGQSLATIDSFDVRSDVNQSATITLSAYYRLPLPESGKDTP